VDFAKRLCGVSIIRSGESMENALRACCKGIKIGKILVHREVMRPTKAGEGQPHPYHALSMQRSVSRDFDCHTVTRSPLRRPVSADNARLSSGQRSQQQSSSAAAQDGAHVGAAAPVTNATANGVANGGSNSREQELIYEKLPKDIAERHVMLMDPILATGNSAARAIQVLLEKGVDEGKILFLTLIAAPEGIHKICAQFPRAKVITSEIDERVDETFRVVPGVGEFGDRYFCD
jgi:uridine kinase